jgi:protein tyrosine phosphatase (PTP) superfamily phosphohydrolase (DUF442 family)
MTPTPIATNTALLDPPVRPEMSAGETRPGPVASEPVTEPQPEPAESRPADIATDVPASASAFPPRVIWPARRGWLAVIVAELLVLALVPAFAYRYIYTRHVYNFHVSQPGVLLRCGQLSEWGLERAIEAHGVKTVINLRWGTEDPEVGPGGVTEKDVCDRHGVKYVFMPVADVVEQPCVPLPRRDGTHVMVPWSVAEFLRIMDDPRNHPVLLHCRVGKHRTGILTAVWKMEQGVSRKEALQEMRDCGFLLDDRAAYWPERAFVETYQPRHGIIADLKYPVHKPDIRHPDSRPGPDPSVAIPHQKPFDETQPARLGRGQKDE